MGIRFVDILLEETLSLEDKDEAILVLPEFSSDRRLVFGRNKKGSSVHVNFSNGGVSRRHFEIEYHEGIYILRDLGSTHGTFYNGERIVSDVVLREGDIIGFGGKSYRFLRS